MIPSRGSAEGVETAVLTSVSEVAQGFLARVTFHEKMPT